jgi:hypothetical protein
VILFKIERGIGKVQNRRFITQVILSFYGVDLFDCQLEKVLLRAEQSRVALYRNKGYSLHIIGADGAFWVRFYCFSHCTRQCTL